MSDNHALDDRTKRRLKSLVIDLRRDLEEDLTKQLRRLGVDAKKGAPTPVEKLSYLEEHEVAARKAVDALIEKEQQVTPKLATAIASVVREGAYTHLNRLVGLKCMEARRLLTVDGEVTEVVTPRPEHGGRPKLLWTMREADSRYRHGEDAEERLWRDALDRAFHAVTEEIRVLFDPEDPYAQVWPSHATLRRVVAALNDLPHEVYLADETLGWIYQYFQSEEKDRVFEEVRTKKKKVQWHDIIPVTSLYTERYMVDFLLQNSIGALWMEMYPDSTLHESWPYYVTPATPRTRPAKPVKEWRVLDPACGSGHFLVVAFDLLRQLYAEERRLAEAGRVPRDWAVPEDQVAATILRKNLYGIDIDPRSVQISALALWLKARGAGLAEAPTLNLVIADCVLGEGEAYKALLDQYEAHPSIQEAIRSIWRSLQHIRDLGSLIRVEEELETAVKKVMKKERKDAPLFESAVDWDEYRARLLQDLREAFLAEAKTDDLGHRLFGVEGRKGVDFVEVLSRRYDVVCTNPPYMGSRNMGTVLKAFVGKHYAPGKRDLYAAFILRCRELAAEAGYVAMVTQQSWMFKPAFAGLRLGNDARARSKPRGFAGLLPASILHSIAHLGPRGFGEISGEHVNSSLIVFVNKQPSKTSSLAAFRVTSPKGPNLKSALLRDAIRGSTPGVAYIARQRSFEDIPGAPVVYWAPNAFLELLSRKETLGSVCDLTDGVSAPDFLVRYGWEVPLGVSRWPIYQKGGGYKKWYGLNWFSCDWLDDGRLIREHILASYPPEKFSLKFKPFERRRSWITWSDVASGSLGARCAHDGDVLGSKGPGIWSECIPDTEILAVLNARAFTYLLRLTNTTMQFSYPSLRDSVLVRVRNQWLSPHVEAAVAIKKLMVANDPREASFRCTGVEEALLSQETNGRSLVGAAEWRQYSRECLLHAIEGRLEECVTESFGLDSSAIEAMNAEVGPSPGLQPLWNGYVNLPDFPELDVRSDLLAYLETLPPRIPSEEELETTRSHLRQLYEGGPGTLLGPKEEAENPESAEEEDNNGAPAAYIPIPTETFLEELSQKLRIHPVSVYWLLEELRREEGIVCKPELKRHTEDYFSVTILRMLGHRWPEQDRYEHEQGHPMIDPKWIDEDGIIPFHACAGERSLIARLRSYLDEQFGPENGPNVETEAGQILGKPLEKWLERNFFKHHVSQFKKRPIAWHIKSEGGTFQAIVYYHKFDRDRLHALRAKYVKDTLDALRSRLAEEKQKGDESRGGVARVAKLEEQIADVQRLDERLRKLLEGTDRDYRIWVPWKDTGDQPHGWRPDINDGVRVNIAPVQRAGLLAATVLSAKDLASLRAPDGRASR